MVQILPANPTKREGLFSSFLGGVAQGVQPAIAGYFQKKQQAEQMHQENEAAKRMGIDLSGISNPEMRKLAFSQAFESPLQGAQRKKIEQDIEQSQGEESFFSKLMGGGDQQEERRAPQRVSGIGVEEELATEPERAPSKFNPDDPSTWSQKQIDNFRSYAGDNRKGKTFAKKAQNEFERRTEEKKKETTYREKTAPFESALSTITRMRELGKTGQLGVGSSLNPLPSRRKASAEYEQLGKSLIALASTIPIRNQMEFETLSDNLFDPTLSDAKREGILSAMEKIIRSSMEGVTPPDENTTRPRAPAAVGARQGGTAPKEKRPMQSFYK